MNALSFQIQVIMNAVFVLEKTSDTEIHDAALAQIKIAMKQISEVLKQT